jgi:hypothetical protein
MTTPITQPPMDSDHGVILTIGVVCNGDRMAMVLPVAIDRSASHPDSICQEAVSAFIANMVPSILPVMVDSAYISFIQGEGMVNGRVPHRSNFDDTAFPGTYGAGNSLPDNCAALLIFYEEPLDIVGSGRMRVAKTFVPGIGEAAWDGTSLSSGVIADLQTFADSCQEGWADVDTPTDSWYRVLSKSVRVSATHLHRIVGQTVRSYIGTQRRRMIPH